MLSIESIQTAVNGVIGPLAPLYSNKYQSTTLRYPRDLGSNPSRRHSIVFTILKNDPKKLGEAGAKAVESINSVLDKSGISIKDVTGTLLSKGTAGLLKEVYQKAPEKIQEISKELSGPLSDVAKSLGSLNRTNGETIGLYIPDTVNVSYGAQYDNISVTSALGKPYFLAQGATSLYNIFKDQNQNGLSLTKLATAAGNDPFVRDFVSTQLGRATGTDLTQLALNAGGYALNPQLQVLFESVGFRQFQFDFIFTPYSQEESKQVEQIITTFKRAAAPEIVPNGVFTQSLYMKIPDAFDIKFYYGNQENKKIHKIGESVLRNINVDYSGSGQWATFDDGAPMQIRMTLDFLETVIIDKNRINQGY